MRIKNPGIKTALKILDALFTFLYFIKTFWLRVSQSLVPKIMSHTPAGSSFKAFAHYCQLSTTGNFSQLNFATVQTNLIKF